MKLKNSIIDPLGKNIAEDLHWLKLEKKWGLSKFPIVIGGEGPPLLCLHGFDSSFFEFRRIYPFLKNKFKLIIPDLLGFGFSPRISSINYNSENIIINLNDIIHKLEITQKINILGASMGGSVAFSLTKKLDTDIDKMILLSPAGLFAKPKKIPRPFNQMGAAFLSLPIVRKNLCRQAFASPDQSVGIAEEQIASIHLGCKGWRNSLACFAKSGGFGGTYENLKNIKIKTICGENDRILGIDELNKFQEIKELNLVKLKNCGHLPHLDLPRLTEKMIVDFLLN
tara:strand:- start:736 stop:1584 length:849 start_codon:yes stop_codon:yes gene_type:complete